MLFRKWIDGDGGFLVVVLLLLMMMVTCALDARCWWLCACACID